MRSQVSLGCAWEMAITHRTNLLATNSEGRVSFHRAILISGWWDWKSAFPQPQHPPPQPAMSASRRFEASRKRPKCANTGHSPTALREGQIDAKPPSHPWLGPASFGGSLPPGKRAAQVYLVLFCMTREARHVRNSEN